MQSFQLMKGLIHFIDEDDDDTDETLVAYAYYTKSIDRIRMLTRAEFDEGVE